MKVLPMALASTISLGMALSVGAQTNTVGADFKNMVSECLNGPLRGSNDPTIGCVLSTKSSLTTEELSYIKAQGLDFQLQRFKGEVKVVLFISPSKVSPGSQASSVSQTQEPIPNWNQKIPNCSTYSPQMRIDNGEMSVNGRTVCQSR